MAPPSDWTVARLAIIFKKGDPALPKNYRPISLIPVMAKLFNTVMYNRVRDLLEQQLPDEQFGFRRGRGCDDANHVLRLLVEKSNEWGETLWLAALYVEKAFDRVQHSALFEALMQADVGATIVGTLRRLYCNMKAFVRL